MNKLQNQISSKSDKMISEQHYKLINETHTNFMVQILQQAEKAESQWFE